MPVLVVVVAVCEMPVDVGVTACGGTTLTMSVVSCIAVIKLNTETVVSVAVYNGPSIVSVVVAIGISFSVDVLFAVAVPVV